MNAIGKELWGYRDTAAPYETFRANHTADTAHLDESFQIWGKRRFRPRASCDGSCPVLNDGIEKSSQISLLRKKVRCKLSIWKK